MKLERKVMILNYSAGLLRIFIVLSKVIERLVKTYSTGIY